MSLRSAFTKLVGTLSEMRAPTPEPPATRRPRPTWASVVAVGGLIAAATASGCSCGDGTNVACDDAGVCMVCDQYGCHSATATKNSGTGGTGGTGGSIGTGGTPGTGGVQGTGGKGTSTSTGGTGGTAPCNPTTATCPCVDGACTDGMSCVNGLCIDGCNFTYECGANMVCANGACVPGCSSGSCPAGYSCANGACSLDPNDPQCGTASPCPAGQICAGGLCTTHCTANSQCAAGQVCDGGSQTCITDPSPKSVCDAAKPCPPPEVCEADGYCHYPCKTLSDCQHIDNRFVACVNDICETQEEVDPQCTLQMPCPAGKSCISNKCF
jgi:hypothetical protein